MCTFIPRHYSLSFLCNISFSLPLSFYFPFSVCLYLFWFYLLLLSTPSLSLFYSFSFISSLFPSLYFFLYSAFLFLLPLSLSSHSLLSDLRHEIITSDEHIISFFILMTLLYLSLLIAYVFLVSFLELKKKYKNIDNFQSLFDGNAKNTGSLRHTRCRAENLKIYYGYRFIDLSSPKEWSL